jgi:hypothetical protein
MNFFELLYDFRFIELLKLDDSLHKVYVVELVAKGLMIWEVGVYSEDYREFLFHTGPKLFELLLI